MTAAAALLGADWTAVWAAVIPVCASILGGGFAMAWKLGSLDRTVKDMGEDVRTMNARIERIESRPVVTWGRRATDRPLTGD